MHTQMPHYQPLISLGIAAVGGTATVGVSALDAQRLKIIVMGQVRHSLFILVLFHPLRYTTYELI